MELTKMIQIPEVISIAFTREIGEDKIKDSDILAAQHNYIRPALTEKLYDEVLANDSSNYDDFLRDYVRPALALLVKWMVFDDLMIDLSDRGVNVLQSDHAQTISNQSKRDAKDSIFHRAEILLNNMVNYVQQQVHENETLYYDFYKSSTDVVEEDILIGGFLIRGDDIQQSSKIDPYY